MIRYDDLSGRYHPPINFRKGHGHNRQKLVTMLSVFVAVVVLGLASAEPGKKPPGFNIVGGDEATPNEWPWQLSLQSTSGFHFCGATLFSDEWVVTAAHCVDGSSAGSVIVVAGEHSISGNSGTEQRLYADSIVMHPQYVFPDYDVAVIHLSTPATLNDYVGLACTPDLSYDYSRSTCWISGWGLLRGDDFFTPDRLQEVEVDVMTTAECRREWGAGINDGVACVQGVGSSANSVGGCNGDSGGPIHCLRDGRWDVIGAASYVYGSCDTRFPTVYCRLSSVWNFIQSETGLGSSCFN